MDYVYGVFHEVDAYEGEDVLLGLYADYVDARDFMLDYCKGSYADWKDEVYILKMKMGQKCDRDYVGYNGERV